MQTQRCLMAIGAHADDIELNLGGTLAKYHANGYGVVYVMSTNNFSGGWLRREPDGTVRHTNPPYHEEMPRRKLEAANAARHFGAEPIHLDHPQRHYTGDDGKKTELRYGCALPAGVPEDFPSILTAYEDAAAVDRLAQLIVDKQPEAILTHGIGATNIEHFATCLLVTKAHAAALKQGYGGLLLQWLELGITAFGPLNNQWNTFVDISGYMQAKLAAIAEHDCQIADVNRLDFPEWGPACGCAQAEVFQITAGELRPGPHAAFSLELAKNLR